MQPCNVLVADDDAEMVRLIQTLLRPMNVCVRDVRDAFSALVHIRHSPPDLAILDVNMPAGNGLSVCEMLATDPALAKLPVIVLTGDPDDDLERRCGILGAHYIRKGIDAMDRLRLLVQEILTSTHESHVKSQFYIG